MNRPRPRGAHGAKAIGPPTHEPTPSDALAASDAAFTPYLRRPQPWTGRLLSDEYLDQASCGGAALERELGYLRAINRALSGTALSLRAVRAAAALAPVVRAEEAAAGRARGLELLDVGTGSGDIARALAASRSPELAVTGLDRRPEMVAAAQARTQPSERVRFVEGDLFALSRQFGGPAFSFVHASLTLHHFPDEAVVEALAEMGRTAINAVIWNDLVRGPVQKAAVRVATLAASRSTRHDARVSVEAGFTAREVEMLAARAGLRVAWRRTSLVYRFAAVLVRA